MLLETMDYQHLTKDRSLGTVELKVNELASEIPDSAESEYRFASTGKKSAAEAIRLDRGGTFKGQLHYVAEFIPALNLKGVKFATGPNELERMVGNGGSDDDDGDVAEDSASSSSVSGAEDGFVPGKVTATRPIGFKGHAKDKASVDTVKTVETVKTTETGRTGRSAATTGTVNTANGSVGQTEKEEPEVGIEMSKEELLTHRGFSLSSSSSFFLPMTLNPSSPLLAHRIRHHHLQR